MQWFAEAPANIALIKYMGKKDKEKNIPTNPSLSYTLNNLLSIVELETKPNQQDYWEPLKDSSTRPLVLSTDAQQRFLSHLNRLKQYYEYSGTFIVRSGNNFPHSSGLASSASSFAALTRCAVSALAELTSKPILPISEQAKLSRLGSGSSCRSFFSPWALWQEEEVTEIVLPYTSLIHQVIIINAAQKTISSSQAHLLCQSSSYYPGRSQQALEHLTSLLNALQRQDWQQAYQICWQEFMDMHQLFSTCSQPFTYLTAGTQKVLGNLQQFWQKHGDGPLVTMDAGPNIHLLYRPDQQQTAEQFKKDYLLDHYHVL